MRSTSYLLILPAAFNIIMWGLVLSCFAAVENYSGAIAIRFFLGVFEAAVTPGFALFTSQWYTKKEQGFRTGIWFSFNGFAQVLYPLPSLLFVLFLINNYLLYRSLVVS